MSGLDLSSLLLQHHLHLLPLPLLLQLLLAVTRPDTRKNEPPRSLNSPSPSTPPLLYGSTALKPNIVRRVWSWPSTLMLPYSPPTHIVLICRQTRLSMHSRLLLPLPPPTLLLHSMLKAEFNPRVLQPVLVPAVVPPVPAVAQRLLLNRVL